MRIGCVPLGAAGDKLRLQKRRAKAQELGDRAIRKFSSDQRTQDQPGWHPRIEAVEGHEPAPGSL